MTSVTRDRYRDDHSRDRGVRSSCPVSEAGTRTRTCPRAAPSRLAVHSVMGMMALFGVLDTVFEGQLELVLGLSTTQVGLFFTVPCKLSRR